MIFFCVGYKGFICDLSAQPQRFQYSKLYMNNKNWTDHASLKIALYSIPMPLEMLF